jgi:hypothetical protein
MLRLVLKSDMDGVFELLRDKSSGLLIGKKALEQ